MVAELSGPEVSNVKEKLNMTVRIRAQSMQGRKATVQLKANIDASSNPDGLGVAVSATGPTAGDVYVHVHVRPDDRFVREGNDLFSQVDLTIVQAAIGAKVAVETLDGTEEIELGKVIARLRRDQPRNADTMRICDALERRLKRL